MNITDGELGGVTNKYTGRWKAILNEQIYRDKLSLIDVKLFLVFVILRSLFVILANYY